MKYSKSLPSSVLLVFMVLVCMVLVNPSFAQAPINSNVALQPAEGGWIYRQQFRYTSARMASAAGTVDIDQLTSISTLVVGITDRVTLVLETPYIFDRQRRTRSTGVSLSDAGFGDLKVMTKVRLARNDFAIGSTSRFDLLAGAELPTGSRDFSTGSVDPIIGGVYSYIDNRHAFHADAIWKFNTGSVTESADTFRYDLAYAYRLAPETYASQNPNALFAGIEINGIAQTNADHEIFLSPGLQYVTQRWIIETSIQLPILQSLDARPTRDYIFALGVRVQF